jgi:hypothetical protein
VATQKKCDADTKACQCELTPPNTTFEPMISYWALRTLATTFDGFGFSKRLHPSLLTGAVSRDDDFVMELIPRDCGDTDAGSSPPPLARARYAIWTVLNNTERLFRWKIDAGEDVNSAPQPQFSLQATPTEVVSKTISSKGVSKVLGGSSCYYAISSLGCRLADVCADSSGFLQANATAVPIYFASRSDFVPAISWLPDCQDGRHPQSI